MKQNALAGSDLQMEGLKGSSAIMIDAQLQRSLDLKTLFKVSQGLMLISRIYITISLTSAKTQGGLKVSIQFLLYKVKVVFYVFILQSYF